MNNNKPGPIVVSVVSGKGGVGKTTTALGLASVMIDRGYSVMIVDTDPMDAGSASFWLDRSSSDDDRVAYLSATAGELEAAIGAGQVPADVVIVDTAPRLDDDGLASIVAVSDLVAVVTQPAPLDVAAASQTISARIEPTGRPYVVVFTIVDSRSMTEAHDARAQMLTLGHPVAGVVVRSFAAVRRAAFDGLLPGALPGPMGKKHRSDLEALASELWQRIETPAPMEG